MSNFTKLMKQAASGAAGETVYVEDVFSTHLYKGASTTNNIVNNIDVSGEGGLIWLKHRVLSGASATSNQHHQLYDTERGATQRLSSNRTNAQDSTGSVMTFNSDGFTLAGSNSVSNNSSNYYVSWTFRKQAGFFDVQTWTGNGDSSLGAGDGSTQTISHNLGSAPGLIIVKDTGNSSDWIVFHRSLGSTHYIKLNTTGAGVDFDGYWNDTDPTSTEFTVGTHYYVNGSGNSFIAYLFAHDDQQFGDDSDESIIKCGSYTGNGNTDGPDINLGFEAQWVIIKRTDGGTNDWIMMDIMRGMPMDSGGAYLRANLPNEEASTAYIQPTATGFKLRNTGSTQVNTSGGTYIYIAIRRPMKTPESGTDVFAIDTLGGTAPSPPRFTSGFPVDMSIDFSRTTTAFSFVTGRLLSETYLRASTDAAEVTNETEEVFDYQDGWNSGSGTSTDIVSYMFKRATGFFDMVAYNGNEVAGTSHNHNLGVTPEMMIVKSRSDSYKWIVWVNGFAITDVMNIDENSAKFTNDMFDTLPTSSVFYLANNVQTNRDGSTYIAYLFATLAGVSKVGSYTGTGSDVDVDCGFSAGARFILIKRTDSSGDWYLYDTFRGIVAGNDPYKILNTRVAEVTNTDYIDPLNAGFTVTSSAPADLNTSGGNYIFLAIA